MGAGFSVKCQKVNTYVQSIGKITKDMEAIENRTKDVQNYLRTQSGLGSCVLGLERLLQEMNFETKGMQNMEQALYTISAEYDKAEKNIIQGAKGVSHSSKTTKDGESPISKWWKDIKDVIKKILTILGPGTGNNNHKQINSIVYDDEGAYGGDQGSPCSESRTKSEKKELYSIVRKYYPDMSDEEIKNYLIKLNSEGCGYVALVNTIFAQYEGRDEEFEKDFGFPMYYNGDLNYDKLLVDLYCDTDNHDKGIFGRDVLDKDEDESTTKGNGTSWSDREYRMNKYLKDKNAGIEMKQKRYGQNKITTENFMEYAEDGHVIISYRYGNLQNEDRTTAQYIDGGHAMTVTGVTDDGRFIVSSWGDKYYIDPNEIITQKDKSGKTHKTSFEFQVVQYKED